MVMYKNYMGCKTRYIRRVNVIKTINGNVYPLVLFLMKFLRAVKNTNGLLLFKCNMLHDNVLLQNCTCEKYEHCFSGAALYCEYREDEK